jgi:hypothetical protein
VEQDRVFSRRKLGVKLTYQFGKDELTYTLRDRTGELRFSVRYEAIDVLAPYMVTIKDRTALLYFGAVGFASFGIAALLKFGTLASVFGLFGFAALFAGIASGGVGLFSIKNTMFKMSPAPPGAGNRALRVMEGESHAEIIAELKTRWRERLRRLHLTVNRLKDPRDEMAKFTWLKERGVISDEEYEAALADLRSEVPGSRVAVDHLN